MLWFRSVFSAEGHPGATVEGFLFPGGGGCVRGVNGDTTDNHPGRVLLPFYSLDMEQQMKLELAVDKYIGDCSWGWAVQGVLPCGLC